MVIVKSYSCMSDARVRKILYSLKKSDKKVLYSGAYYCDDLEKFKVDGVAYSLISRKRTVINLFKASILDLVTISKLNEGDCIYFIDEYLPFVLLPYLFFLKSKKVRLILDLFDSYYLKLNRNRIVGSLLKILYSPFDFILVTDNNRKKLMSHLILEKKIKVIENYPFFTQLPKCRTRDIPVNLLFYGSLSDSRGWPFIRQFQNLENFRVYMAGWDFLNLEERNLPDNFIILGLMSQDHIIQFMRDKIDWVFCLYEPTTENNINASPNKIYDALHAGCGTIINREVKVSRFVEESNLGLVIENYHDNIKPYLKRLELKDFKCFKDKTTLLNYSFDKYLDFYQAL